MKKYRILIETEASGKKWYTPQRRCCLIFWVGIKIYKRGILRGTINDTLEGAEYSIKRDIEQQELSLQKKIIKREYLPK